MKLSELIAKFIAALFGKSKGGDPVVAGDALASYPISAAEMEAALKAATLGRAVDAEQKAAAIRVACARASWTDRRSIAHALVHGAHESKDFSKTEEDLSYSESRLLQIFPTRVKPDDAKRLAGNPYAIAEHVYGNRPKLGNTEPGDGYNFRGFSWAQLTGGDAHRKFAAYIKRAVTELWTLKDDYRINAEALVWFANVYKPNFVPTAQLGSLLDTTRIWNGGTNGLEDRARRLIPTLKALGLEP